MRIVCGIEYDGAAYSGWQHQDHAHAVQTQVEAALSRVADQRVHSYCAGRTDAGVHATWQVIHFDTDAQRSERSWILGSNANLPGDVRLLWAREVSDAFHARFSARSRRYRYIILNRAVSSALLRDRVTWEHQPLDEIRMQAGAQYLLGEHDFSSFRAVACQARSPVRTVRLLEIQRHGDFLYLDIEANAFLHHMVRNIAGVLMAIGRGERESEWVADILEQRDRTRGGVTAPARGLYLVGVRYPQEYALESRGVLPVFG